MNFLHVASTQGYRSIIDERELFVFSYRVTCGTCEVSLAQLLGWSTLSICHAMMIDQIEPTSPLHRSHSLIRRGKWVCFCFSEMGGLIIDRTPLKKKHSVANILLTGGPEPRQKREAGSGRLQLVANTLVE